MIGRCFELVQYAIDRSPSHGENEQSFGYDSGELGKDNNS